MIAAEEIIKEFQNYSIKLIDESIEAGRDIAQSQAGTEAESSKDYSGRVVFEFFQNAIDRATSNVWLELTQDSLIVSNDGEAFSIYKDKNEHGKKSDFYSLNTIHNGDKVSGESIGNKGVGFKSCWNVSNHVIIESINQEKEAWGFELFNPVKSDNYQSEKIIDAIKKGGTIPSFYFPKYYKESSTKRFRSASKDKVTIITIKFKEDNKEKAYIEVKEELEEFIKSKFFFINQLENKTDKDFNINIKIDGEEVNELKSKDNEWHIISLKDKYSDDWKELTKSRHSETYKNIPKEPNIAMAFPPNNSEDIDAKFYTYLPTKAKCGFNVLIHADFALDNARVSIPDNDYNKKILEIAAKIFVNELLTNTELHKRTDFAKFLMPDNKNDEFAKLVWKKLILDNKLTEILKKVYTKDSIFPKESYEMIFKVIEEWKHRDGYSDVYYNEIYNKSIQYFCDTEILIVYIDEENKTFLPEKKKDKKYDYHLFFKTKEDEDSKLNFDLLEGIKNLKITTFEPLGNEKFIKNTIVRKFSTLEILRTLKDVELINILEFIEQLLSNTKNSMSDDVKKQLLDIKIPTVNGDFKEVKYCYFNIEDDIKNLFNDTFYEVDEKNLKEDFLIKLGIANNRLPFVQDKDIKLPFKENITFMKSEKLKNFINKSLIYFDENIIETLKDIKWFWDERKNKLYKPNELFLFKEHDHRKIECIAQEKKDSRYSELYSKFNIDEIDDTTNSVKLIIQLNKMKDTNRDSYHQDIYKKITFQLAKILKEKDEKFSIPILATNIDSNKIEYVDIKNKDKVIFLETKYKQYKEQLKDIYDYIGYFDTNTAHNFLEKIVEITIFNPGYNIQYKNEQNDTEPPIVDNDLKEKLQKEFLAPFFALAHEILGSSFEKEDAIRRWENLTIKKAYNVLLTIEDKNKTITVSSTKNRNVDVLYIPIKDKQNKPTHVGEVAHDLDKPLENSNLRKFAQVFAEGIFRNQKLKSDFELYITGDKNLKKDILNNKGVDEIHIEEMENFIKENLLKQDEKQKILEKFQGLKIEITNYSEIRYFEKYQDCKLTFEEFIAKFEEKYKNIIVNILEEYKRYLKQLILNEITQENQNQYLEVLCFIKHTSRDYFNNKVEKIKKEEYLNFIVDKDIFKRFDIHRIDENSDEYIELKFDFDFETGRIPQKVLKFENTENTLVSQENPPTGSAEKSENQKSEEHTREEKNQSRGKGRELELSFKYAKKLYEQNLQDKFLSELKKVYTENNTDINIKNYAKILKDSNNLSKFEYAKKIINIANNKLDGLGYDLVLPKYNEDKTDIIGVLKVELKTTIGQGAVKVMHFSKNEISRILYFLNDPDFMVFLNIEENDITAQVKKAVLDLTEKMKNISFVFDDYILKLKTKG